MTMRLGAGNFQYEFDADWPSIPDAVNLVEAIGVAVDSQDRLFVFNRGGEQPVLVFDRDGRFEAAWGEGQFVRPHGVTVATDDSVYLTDDLGHRVGRYAADGRLLRNIGPVAVPSPTGVDGFDYRTISSAGPFNLPTNVALADDGSLFIADGYGNARIHHFNPDGELVGSWGEAGDGVGHFNVPHGVCVDERDRVFVADRENSRIEVFDRRGNHLARWSDVVRPCQIVARGGVYFVAEMGNARGRFPWQPEPAAPMGGRVSIFDAEGNLLTRWGGGLDPLSPDGFYACHDIAVDSHGDIYVGEVAVTVATTAGEDPSGLPTLRKYRRVN